jgi:hypothetical protein
VSGGWAIAFGLLSSTTVLLCILFLALSRYVAALATRLPEPLPLELTQGPEVGSSLRDHPLPESVAETLATKEAGSPRTMILFLSTSCSSCYRLVSDLNRFARDARDTSIVVAVAGREEEGDRFKNAIQTSSTVFPDPEGRLSRSFGISTVPFAIVYEEGLLKAKGVVNNRTMLENLSEGFTRKGGDDLLAAFNGGRI